MVVAKKSSAQITQRYLPILVGVAESASRDGWTVDDRAARAGLLMGQGSCLNVRHTYVRHTLVCRVDQQVDQRRTLIQVVLQGRRLPIRLVPSERDKLKCVGQSVGQSVSD